jgi:ubiquinone/menaquinone biosynthesis C-methylase UbiE
MTGTQQGLFTGSLPEMYERYLVAPLFRPFAQALLNAAGVGDSLLDVACGTGVVARLARGAGGDRVRVVGVDVSPGMLAMARSIAPDIDWREGDVAHLPVAADEKFEVVVCHQGLQFFPDKPAAVAEMRRAIAPGGRLAVATWRPIDEVPLMRELKRVAVVHLGDFVDHRHGFGDADAIRRLLAEAGFTSPQISSVTRTIRMPDGETALARLNAMAMVGMSPAAKAMSDEQRAETIANIVSDSAEVIASYLEGDDLVFDISSNVAVASA